VNVCRQATTAGTALQNLQTSFSPSLTLQRSANSSCTGQAQPLPDLDNPEAVLLTDGDTPGKLAVASLQTFPSQALQIEVPIGLPAPPSFVRVPRWSSSLSTATSAAVSGQVDGPALIFYAVRNCHVPQFNCLQS
jgi:hypothetical protein